MTNKPVVIVGMGEMGGVFARGFLRSGCPVFPVTRQMNASLVAEELPDPELVLLAVAEADFAPVIEGVPNVWRDRLVLLQNELLPWQHPTGKDSYRSQLQLLQTLLIRITTEAEQVPIQQNFDL